MAAPKPVSPEHSSDAAERQASRASTVSAQRGHALVLGGALRPGWVIADQLHLAELVLAQHAARVPPGGAGLAAEALGQRGHADRQRAPRPRSRPRPGWSAAPRRSGSASGRRWCGTDPRRISAACRCRTSAASLTSSGTDGLRVAVLARVQVEHELAERPLQPRERAAQDGEARAGHACAAASKSIMPERLAELEMLLAAGSRASRGSPYCLSTTLALSSGAVRHVGVEDVRQRLQHAARIAPSSAAARSSSPRHLARAARRASASSAAVSAPGPLALADLLGERVAPRLQLLQPRSARAALGIQARGWRRRRGGRPRRARSRSKAAGSARIARMSCIRCLHRLGFDHRARWIEIS